MFLVLVKNDGMLVSLMRLSVWGFAPNPLNYPNFFRDIVTNVGIDTDSNNNVYIGVYSEKTPPH